MDDVKLLAWDVIEAQISEVEEKLVSAKCCVEGATRETLDVVLAQANKQAYEFDRYMNAIESKLSSATQTMAKARRTRQAAQAHHAFSRRTQASELTKQLQAALPASVAAWLGKELSRGDMIGTVAETDGMQAWNSDPLVCPLLLPSGADMPFIPWVESCWQLPANWRYKALS